MALRDDRDCIGFDSFGSNTRVDRGDYCNRRLVRVRESTGFIVALSNKLKSFCDKSSIEVEIRFRIRVLRGRIVCTFRLSAFSLT